MKPKKTWKEKLLDKKDLPKIVTLYANVFGTSRSRWGAKVGDTMIIPSPVDVNQIMKRVKKGKLITINEIRKSLAKKYNTTIACPITTGIFAWISAHAADEELKSGKKKITPYWRTLKSNGEINEKYPGGVKKQIELLKSEGFEIIRKGKKFFVKDFEKYLIRDLTI